MPRFYAPKENIKGNLIYIDEGEARHILAVMRLKESDKVSVFDGTGKEYAGFIKEASPKSLVVEIVSTDLPKRESLPNITLAQAIPKKDKMDYIVEKATELGVGSIIPLISERTVVRVDSDKTVGRVSRWQRIALEAAKQCGRYDVPEIKSASKFYDVIESVNDFGLGLMACLSDNTAPLKEAISDFKGNKMIVFIGPEGDFTPGEIQAARDRNLKLVSLGNRVLKSDNAGLFALSVLNYEFAR